MMTQDPTQEQQDLQVVTFPLEDEWLGLSVGEVVRVEPLTRFLLTRMPRVPDVVEGIVNYRGEIFPLVNGRRLLGFERKDFGEDSSIVMVSCGDERFGLVVDRIPEVRALPYASMQEFPKRRGARIDQDLIRCLCQDGDRMVIVIDAEALLKKIDVTQPTN